MWRRLFRRPKVDDGLLQLSIDIIRLPRTELASVIRQMLKDDARKSDDLYCIFLKCREDGLFANTEISDEAVSRLRCLVDVDSSSATRILSNTTPPDNVIYAIERLIFEGNVSKHEGNQAIFRFITGCTQRLADRVYRTQRSVIQMVDSAREAHGINERTAITAKHAYYLLLAPESIQSLRRRQGVPIDHSLELFQAAERRRFGKTNIALMREWKPIPLDIIQDILNKGYGGTLDQAKQEYLVRELMREFSVDRRDATTEIEKSNGNLESARKACAGIEKMAKKTLGGPPIVPTRDTRGAPNVTKKTRILAVLGVDEAGPKANGASPSLGDGWMVSDFYLWLHVLQGMGRSQEWITSIPPEYLLEKYGREDKTTVVDIPTIGAEQGEFKPAQSKWASGLIHGDPFEARKVVLDDDLLPEVRNRVTVIPNGSDLRNFFLKRLKDTVSEAAKCGDRVLLMFFCHGDYGTQG